VTVCKTSRSFYSELITYCHTTSRNDKIAWKKNRKYNTKTAVYHTVNGDSALLHTSTTATGQPKVSARQQYEGHSEEIYDK